MVDDVDLVKAVHSKALEFDFLRHQLTISGLADQVGIIETNALNPESVLNPHSKKAKEKKKLQRWIAEMLSGMLDWPPARHVLEIGKMTGWMEQKAVEFQKQSQKMLKLVEDNIEAMQSNADFVAASTAVINAYENDEAVDSQNIYGLLEKRNIHVSKEDPIPSLIQTLKSERKNAIQHNEKLEIEIIDHEENARHWEEKSEQYRQVAQNVRQRVTSVQTSLEKSQIDEEESKKEFIEIWEDIPREVLKEYEKENGASEYSAQIKRQQEYLKAEEPISPSKLDSLQGILVVSFNEKAVGIENVLAPDPIQAPEFNPLDL